LPQETIRLLIVDDSTAVRRVLSSLLQEDPTIEIAGEACDGAEAVRLAEELKPDLITMDILMPKMNGFEAIKHIMAYNPTPILVITGIPMRDDRNLLSEALRLGALDIVEKPTLAQLTKSPLELDKLRQKVHTLARAKVITHLDGRLSEWRRREDVGPAPVRCKDGVICIGSSAGGPEVLYRVLSALPENPPCPILIAQHLAPFFINDFVTLLQKHSKFPVKRAKDGDALAAGEALVSPGDRHMIVRKDRRIDLLIPSTDDIFIPSVDRLFTSCAEVFDRRTLGIVLSGMGDDGVKGSRAIRQRKGIVIAQEEEGCPIWGMPRAVIESNLADHVRGVDAIPGEILAFARMLGKAHTHAPRET
jgi:two-component system chemotaxis response regulator CheB